MFTKYDYISALATEATENATKTAEHWMHYLNTASRLYKYPFCEQILIHTQRPDATACASIGVWNDKMHCWVNKGAKGIALIDTDSERPKLKYVFDVSDVHRARLIGKDPYLWVMRKEYREPVMERLEGIYGETDRNLPFEDRLLQLSRQIAIDYLDVYADDLAYNVKGSYLDGLDDIGILMRFRETLSASIAYTLFNRCGCDKEGYMEEFNFDFLHDFNTVDTITVLGNATSEMAKPVLMEIGRTIAAIERERAKARAHGEQSESIENNPEKGLANVPEKDYSALKRESETKEETITERIDTRKEGDIHEADIREERGLSDPESATEPGTGGEPDEIRADEEELPAEPQERDVPGDDLKRDAESTLPGDPENGRGEDGEDDRADGEGRGSGRSPQGERSDGLGGEDELDHSQSGRDYPLGSDLQLGTAPEGEYEQISLFPLMSEQLGTIAAAQAEWKPEMSAAFSLNEERVKDILRSGSGRDNSRKRIYAKFAEAFDYQEMEAILIKEYGRMGKGFDIDGHSVSIWSDLQGIHAGLGTSAFGNPLKMEAEGRTFNGVIPWGYVESLIRGMIEKGDYVNQREAFLAFAEERERIAGQVYFFFRDSIGEFPEELSDRSGGFPEETARISEMLGTPEGNRLIARRMDGYLSQVERGERKIKHRSVRHAVEVRREVDYLTRKRYAYPAKEEVNILTENFITQDEIDSVLTRGSGFSEGAFRIYEYFLTDPDPKKAAEFLRNEYGTGGSSHAITGSDNSWSSHDGKGIHLSKGDIMSPDTEILLNWNTVQKRIRQLVAEGRYLSPDKLEAYERYKQEKTQRDMERAQVALSSGADEPEADEERESMENAYGSDIEGLEEFFSIDKQEFRKKLENGYADREVDAMLAFAERIAAESDAELERDSEKESENEDNYDWHSAEGVEIPFGEEQLKNRQTVISGEENGLPYDIVIEKLPAEETKVLEPDIWEEDILNGQTIELPKRAAVSFSNADNFRITDDALGRGSLKEKFGRNIAAIETLNLIESEKRPATPEEQQILSQYVGWGGLADAFDDSKSAWEAEYAQLKELLSPEEYASARESTLNAHYTSPVIIRSIYEALDKMGFEKGNVLEPAMGIGNFFGMIPEKMQDSRLYGVELDGITGRIARQLYPGADVRITGYEKTDFPNDFFDVAVGNVPFGQYKVADRQYDKNNFLIHDYFFAKTLDKVRPGGVVAFVTSKGTMDKKSPEVRRYMAQRAELLGAVRLPNTAFKENAGTEVTSDILFLKKRDRVMDIEPEWVHLSEDENGITMNSYFVEHPEMIVGKMEMVSGPYGPESTCQPDTERPFEEQLRSAIANIDGQIEAVELDELADDLMDETIPADPNVKNYSYTLVDDKVYYRENSVMKPVDMTESMLGRIRGMAGIRDTTQELINLQLEDYPEHMIKAKQAELNVRYDEFSKKYGLISSQTNKRAFNQDSSYCLLCSLEKLDDEGNFLGKADMFTKRTIKKAEVVTSVDTPSEALAVSLSERAGVDLDYMAKLLMNEADHADGEGLERITETIIRELEGVIFKNPLTQRFETADEYLSGNVRDKLKIAEKYAQDDPAYAPNVRALSGVQPADLDASEIGVRIGATWIDAFYIDDFMRDIFQTPEHLFDRGITGTQFTDVTGRWNIKGKNADYGNSLINMTYGTSRVNGYKILEDSLNLKDTRVYDTIYEDGKEKRVLNKKETMIASQKQEAIREAFRDWIFRNPDRRQALVEKYNMLFNSTRPREYDGSHLKFPGMTPDIELKPHQLNAIAHVLYGDNTLLAHCVGAGKTFEMTAAAMESKRLGLCQKSLFVVPNHLTEQWASDFLRLYPGANILAATRKDFEPANRKKFCSRIATGDYDAVIIGHSQFEKIPLSTERQIAIVERQIEEIEENIALAKADRGERYTVKQMEKTRKSLKARLDKLNNDTRKDNVVTFEQLGVDRLFVDESHNYKNLFLYTKMRNVAGIAQTEAQKSSDMFAKCQYLDDVICCEL